MERKRNLRDIMKKQLEEYLELLKNASEETLSKSMGDTHIKDNFSLVFGGTENGMLTRAFLANKKIKPYEAQLHSHRYDLKITVIKGEVKHHVAEFSDFKGNKMSLFEYKSPLNEGNGLKFIDDVFVDIKEYTIPIGSSIFLKHDEIHTISCSKGSIWIVEELGFKSDKSEVLGVPFIIEDLYNKPEQYQINDNYQLLKKYITKILNDYRDNG